MSNIGITIERIVSLEPHPNADRLEIAHILGTQTLVPKDQYEVNDLVVFFPPDMLLPPATAVELGVEKYLKHAEWDGASVRCRVAACRLQGIPSYGFVTPTTGHVQLESAACGLDVTQYYGGIKYEPPVKTSMGNATFDRPAFHKYTDIQHFYRHPDLIPDGMLVRITEKIHGCVKATTRITMVDGSKKKIGQIQAGDTVLGVRNGQVVPSRVLNTYNNGRSDNWLRVEVERKSAGRGGNATGSLYCTPNHRFWSPEAGDYIQADQLRVGGSISLLRTDCDLTPVQHSVLLGMMLGDASIRLFDCGTALIATCHVCQELLDWTSRGLGGLLTQTKDQVSGFGSTTHRAHTVASWNIAKAFGDFYTTDREFGAKQVPTWVADALTPLAVAFWYMNDGNLNHGGDGSQDKAGFAVCRYNEADCRVLELGLAKFGIGVVYFRDKQGYSRFRLNADDAERLFLLVAPYLPAAMQYKLPLRYRGHAGWLPPTGVSYKPLLVPQRVTAIAEHIAPRANRHDIETETHNYFANSILTHNSNSRVGLIKTDTGFEFLAGSHNRVRVHPEEGSESLYWRPLEDKGVLDLLTDLCEGCDGQPSHNVVVFGELFGPGIQDMDYGVKQGHVGYEVFDISVDGRYLNWNDVFRVCFIYGVPTVPLFYEGHFVKADMDRYTDGPTTSQGVAAKFTGREGCVITPVVEQYVHGSRVILKSVSADYYDRKGAKDNGEL